MSPDGRVAIDEMRDDFEPLKPGARLWPQTERLKSAALQAVTAEDASDRAAFFAEAQTALQSLRLYLDAGQPGLWRDKRRVDGSFVEEFAPASTLYHIVAAVEQLQFRITH